MAARRRTHYTRNFSGESAAVRIRENFRDEPATKEIALSWTWPKSMIEVGVCEAVMYASDKWKKPGDIEDYKHRAEGAQQVYVRRGFLVDHFTGKGFKVYGETVDIDGMPAKIALLAPILGIQCRFFDKDGELGDDAYQIDIKDALLGAGEHKDGGKFLCVYTENAGPYVIITGDELDVEKDGIVG